MSNEALRSKFEKWVMAVEHHPFGWLGREWLDRLDDSYEDPYIHGLWTGFLACNTVKELRAPVESRWISCKERMPEPEVDVLVRYFMPWPRDHKIVVSGARCAKAFDDVDQLFWFNGKGEAMLGNITHWMPMIETGVE